MPVVNWGISPDSVDDYEDNGYTPYMGPTNIPAGVYQWRIAVLKRAPKSADKLPQLRVGLELVPRKGIKEEQKFKGFFTMDFMPVSDKTQFRYASFLAVLGVSGTDFTKRCRFDADGNITSIGKWKMDGKTILAAQLIDDKDMDGNPRKAIKGGAYFPMPDGDDIEDDEDFDDDEDVYDEDVDLEDESEEDDDYYEEDDSDEDEEEDEDELDEIIPARREVKQAVRSARAKERRRVPRDEEEEKPAPKRRSAASAGTRGRTTASKSTASKRTSSGSKATSTARRRRA